MNQQHPAPTGDQDDRLSWHRIDGTWTASTTAFVDEHLYYRITPAPDASGRYTLDATSPELMLDSAPGRFDTAEEAKAAAERLEAGWVDCAMDALKETRDN